MHKEVEYSLAYHRRYLDNDRHKQLREHIRTVIADQHDVSIEEAFAN